LGKIIQIIVATRGQILKLKRTKYYFGQTPLREITALAQNPSWKEAYTSKGMGGD